MKITWLKTAEVQNIKLSDIDWVDKSIRVFGKNKKYRTVYINAKAETSIKRYLSGRNGNSEYLFCGFRYPYDKLSLSAYRGLIEDIRSRSSISYKVTPHILRHTFASLALQSGMNIEIIQVLLGHADLRTTRIYAKNNMSDIKYAHAKYVT